MKDKPLRVAVGFFPFDEPDRSVCDLYTRDVAVGKTAAPAVKVYWFCF